MIIVGFERKLFLSAFNGSMNYDLGWPSEVIWFWKTSVWLERWAVGWDTVKTQIEDTGARTLEFPFSATRGENTAKLSPQLRQNKRDIPGALLGEATPTS